MALTNHPHLAPRLKKEYRYTSTFSLSLHGLFEGEFYLYLYSPCTVNTLPGKLLKDFKIGGNILRTVKCDDELLLQATEEKPLQALSGRLIEVARFFGMQMNVKKTKVMSISRQSCLTKIMIDQKQLENVEYLRSFCSLITNNARRAREIKSRIAR